MRAGRAVGFWRGMAVRFLVNESAGSVGRGEASRVDDSLGETREEIDDAEEGEREPKERVIPAGADECFNVHEN